MSSSAAGKDVEKSLGVTLPTKWFNAYTDSIHKDSLKRLGGSELADPLMAILNNKLWGALA